jgi:hypothetical protein
LTQQNETRIKLGHVSGQNLFDTVFSSIYMLQSGKLPSNHMKQLSPSTFCIGGLVVKLAVAILQRTVSASPGFDSRPMQVFFFVDVVVIVVVLVVVDHR